MLAVTLPPYATALISIKPISLNLIRTPREATHMKQTLILIMRLFYLQVGF